MRAPVLVFGQIRPSKQGLAYRTDSGVSPEAFGADIGRGLGQLGESLVQVGEEYERRNAKTERFGALIGLSEFQVQANEALTNLKRTAPPTGVDFPKMADDLYKTYEQQYLAKLPPNLVPEFHYRSQQIRQGVMTESLDFQYKQQDAFYVEGIKTEYERAKNGIYSTPDEYEKWSAHMAEVIGSSDLPPLEKIRLANEIRGGLLAVKYGKDVEGAARSGVVGGDIVDRIIQVESGGDPNASPSTSRALGLGQFIPSTWKAFIAERHPDLLAQGDDIQKLRTDPKLGREAVEWYIGKNTAYLQSKGLPITAGNVYLAHFLGPAGAANLLAASPNTPVSEVVGADQIAANRSILAGKTVGEVIDWATQKMGGTSISGIDEDPQYQDIPLEDRLAIQAGAQRKVDEEVAAATKAAADAAEAARNALYVGLHDGTMDEADLQTARNSGLITDMDDIEKAEKILADRTKGVADAQFIEAATAAGGAGYGTQDNEAFNNWFKSTKGSDATSARDIGTFNTSILPKVQTLQDIPSDLIGLLTTMSRSNDVQAMRWAHDRLLDLQDKAPAAFDARTPEDLARRADQYRFMIGSATDEELNDYVRGGRNPQEIAINPRMDEQAVKILANPESDAAKLSADIASEWDTWWPLDKPSEAPVSAAEMQLEFRAGFINNFRATGDETSAIELTKTQLKRVWDVTKIGGRGNQLMRLPPHKVGYPKHDVTVGGPTVEIDYDAIIRTEYGIMDDEEFSLVSDRQTAQELATRQSAGGPLPSYVVYKYVAGRPIPQSGRWRYP